MAVIIGKDSVTRRLVAGDVNAKEIFYHKPEAKPCLALFHREYDNAVTTKEKKVLEEWVKLSSLNKVYLHMWEEKSKGVKAFNVVELERRFIKILADAGHVPPASHTSRFTEWLLTNNN